MKKIKKEVPFFNYPYLFESREEDFVEIFKDVGRRGAYILQKDLTKFESDLATYCNAKYAIGVANGTDAIWLALEAAGIVEGDEVILSSHTYIATAGAIAFVKAKPIPVECKEDWMIDPSAVEAAITPKTKAMVIPHLYGYGANMSEILELARSHSLLIIEDAAQALGVEIDGKKAGTFGDFGNF